MEKGERGECYEIRRLMFIFKSLKKENKCYDERVNISDGGKVFIREFNSTVLVSNALI